MTDKSKQFRPYPNESQLPLEAKLRVRISFHEAHYGGHLVDGARILGFFGDIATELLIHWDGDEGLFRAYQEVEFLAPVKAGDYLEISGKIVKVGKSSRAMEFAAYKVIEYLGAPHEGSARILSEPLLVCKAKGTCVTPQEMQRKS